MHRPTRTLATIPALLLLGAIACGDDGGGGGYGRGGDDGDTGEGAAASNGPTVVAADTAFDVTELDARVGEELTITFDNQDEGTEHNLHVDGAADGAVATEITAGPDTQTLTVRFDEAGEFEYHCEVHSSEMTGTITVEE